MLLHVTLHVTAHVTVFYKDFLLKMEHVTTLLLYFEKNTLYILLKIIFALTCQKFINSTKFTLILIVFDSNMRSNLCSNVPDNVTV